MPEYGGRYKKSIPETKIAMAPFFKLPPKGSHPCQKSPLGVYLNKLGPFPWQFSKSCYTIFSDLYGLNILPSISCQVDFFSHLTSPPPYLDGFGQILDGFRRIWTNYGWIMYRFGRIWTRCGLGRDL